MVVNYLAHWPKEQSPILQVQRQRGQRWRCGGSVGRWGFANSLYANQKMIINTWKVRNRLTSYRDGPRDFVVDWEMTEILFYFYSVRIHCEQWLDGTEVPRDLKISPGRSRGCEWRHEYLWKAGTNITLRRYIARLWGWYINNILEGNWWQTIRYKIHSIRYMA